MSEDPLQRLCDAANSLRVIREPMRLRLHKIKSGPLSNCRKTNPAARKYR